MKNINEQLLEDLALYGECAYHISDSEITRIHPMNIIVNQRKLKGYLRDKKGRFTSKFTNNLSIMRDEYKVTGSKINDNK